jgi:hypothetical protein
MTWRAWGPVAAGAFAATLCALPMSAWAQAPPGKPACAAISDAGLPAALAGWTGRSHLAAAATAADVGKAALPIGTGVEAQLRRTGEVTYPVLPAKPGGSVSYGGLYEIRIAEGGDYQVSLGAGAWIEVVSGKTPVVSTAHAPGPACSTLRKTVVFPLTPGNYVLEITGNGAATLPVMVTRVVK